MRRDLGLIAGMVGALLLAGGSRGPLRAAQALPEGDAGIAAAYAQDQGIAADPAVIFADDFEAYRSVSEIGAVWNAGLYHHVALSSSKGEKFAGAQALQFTSPKQDAELSNGAARALTQGEDLIFLRYYSKFDSSFDVRGSSHNGGGISASYFEEGRATPGVRADGRNKIWVSLEAWRDDLAEANPGKQNLYVYHPEQRSQWGDHFFPSGTVLPFTYKPGDFGQNFVARPDIAVKLGRWYCYELMVRANTPGKRDGRIAWWLDGRLAADHPGLRLRDVASLKFDRVDLSLHIGSNPRRETKKWYDNIVVARAYIGPMAGPK